MALAIAAAPPPAEGGEARAQLRLCLAEARVDPSATACRRALELGLSPARAALAQDVLALRLAAAGRWEESVLALSELARLRPGDAPSRLRLASALLHGLGRAAEALEPLAEAARLAPASARVHAELALAYNQLGDPARARAEFEQALRLDPSCLEDRPAARLAFEAARGGRSWP